MSGTFGSGVEETPLVMIQNLRTTRTSIARCEGEGGLVRLQYQSRAELGTRNT
jgi:hypothetical protein